MVFMAIDNGILKKSFETQDLQQCINIEIEIVVNEIQCRSYIEDYSSRFFQCKYNARKLFRLMLSQLYINYEDRFCFHIILVNTWVKRMIACLKTNSSMLDMVLGI
jgi:hypothetical protein